MSTQNAIHKKLLNLLCIVKKLASILNSVANFIVLTLFILMGKIWDSPFCVLSDHRLNFLKDGVCFIWFEA